jgi:hypothetical protein
MRVAVEDCADNSTKSVDEHKPFYAVLHDIGETYHVERAELHARAIEKVLELIIAQPDRIGLVRDSGPVPRRLGAELVVRSLTMFFDPSDPEDPHDDDDYMSDDDHIVFKWLDGNLRSIVVRYDGSWGDLTICFIGGELERKAKMAIDAVNAVRLA